MDETGTHDEPDDQVCLDNIKEHVTMAKKDFHEAEKALRSFFNDDGDDEDDDESEDEDGDDSEAKENEEGAEDEVKK